MNLKKIRHRVVVFRRIGLLAGSAVFLGSAAQAPAVAQSAASAGDMLLQSAQQLETAGKWNDAADAYKKAAAAYEKEGNASAQVAALGKSATMYEKYADELLAGVGGVGNSAPAIPAMPATPAIPETPAQAAPAKLVKLAPLAPRPGYVIGRTIFEDGRPVPKADVRTGGFDGQVSLLRGLPSLGMGTATNGRYAIRTMDTLHQERPVDARVVMVEATAKIMYQNLEYQMSMYPIDGKSNGSAPGDFVGESGKGVVRDFVLKMTGLRPGQSADDLSESSYRNAYYGGVLEFDGSVSAKPGINYTDETSLSKAAQGDVEITLTPTGPLLDGSTGRTLHVTVPIAAFGLGGDWHRRVLRNIPIGVYIATARLISQGGGGQALHVRDSLLPVSTWQPSQTVTWTPNPRIPYILTSPTLYIGQ